jgi:hypothetical protein
MEAGGAGRKQDLGGGLRQARLGLHGRSAHSVSSSLLCKKSDASLVCKVPVAPLRPLLARSSSAPSAPSSSLPCRSPSPHSARPSDRFDRLSLFPIPAPVLHSEPGTMTDRMNVFVKDARLGGHVQGAGSVRAHGLT